MVERAIGVQQNLLALARNVLKLRHKLLEIGRLGGRVTADCGASLMQHSDAPNGAQSALGARVNRIVKPFDGSPVQLARQAANRIQFG
jgi:hypothetical protein